MDDGNLYAARRNLLVTSFGICLFCLAGGSFEPAAGESRVTVLGGSIYLEFESVLVVFVLALFGWFWLRFNMFREPQKATFQKVLDHWIEHDPGYVHFVRQTIQLAAPAQIDWRQTKHKIRLPKVKKTKRGDYLIYNVSGAVFKDASGREHRLRQQSTKPSELALNWQTYDLILNRIKAHLILHNPEWSNYLLPTYIARITVAIVAVRLLIWAIQG